MQTSPGPVDVLELDGSGCSSGTYMGLMSVALPTGGTRSTAVCSCNRTTMVRPLGLAVSNTNLNPNNPNPDPDLLGS